ncbi:acylneuraminate cytidylyltransferase family protein [Lachnospiraceae bacterium 47-T17]
MEEDRRRLGVEKSNMERIRHLAVVPARSGSKGLKDKNIKKLNGKHLMGYSIEAALNANIFDCVHVSTDSEEYREIARLYGADVSFLRPEGLSVDTADTWNAVRHVVRTFECMGKYFNMVTLLQPTSPLRTSEDIRNAYMLFKEKHAQSVISVCEADHSPMFMKPLGRELSMQDFVNLNQNVRRQERKIYYRLNGAIYMLDRSVLDSIQEIYGKRSYAYVMPRERSVDIDTKDDFCYAEFLLGNGARK